jgi:bifunctional N-acetylglucosamine-1-phosphate-uridyltransferase/glucosamine-1-phosphate-acetyltransferase GlmU-like protein
VSALTVRNASGLTAGTGKRIRTPIGKTLLFIPGAPNLGNQITQCSRLVPTSRDILVIMKNGDPKAAAHDTFVTV